MIFVKIFFVLIFYILKFNGIYPTEISPIDHKNEFFERLENLIEYCTFDVENGVEGSSFDAKNEFGGILLGVLIAKGQLRDLKYKNPKAERNFRKLENLEKEIRNRNGGELYQNRYL